MPTLARRTLQCLDDSLEGSSPIWTIPRPDRESAISITIKVLRNPDDGVIFLSDVAGLINATKIDIEQPSSTFGTSSLFEHSHDGLRHQLNLKKRGLSATIDMQMMKPTSPLTSSSSSARFTAY